MIKIHVFITSLFLFFQVSAQPSLDKQAHRGGRGIMPENTIRAMKYALDMECTLEMDLSYTKDKQVIVSHDNYMSSIFVLDPGGNSISKEEEKNYRLYNLTYDEIKQFDVGSKPHSEFPRQKKYKDHIPLLTVMLDSVETYARQTGKTPYYNIEAKMAVPKDENANVFREEFIKKIVAIIRNRRIESRVMVQSFDIGMLEVLHRDYPDIKISYLVPRHTLEENLKKLTFIPDIYSPLYTLVTPELVEQCHHRNMKIIPWTVNTKPEIEALKAMDVDGIITDFPDLF